MIVAKGPRADAKNVLRVRIPGVEALATVIRRVLVVLADDFFQNQHALG